MIKLLIFYLALGSIFFYIVSKRVSAKKLIKNPIWRLPIFLYFPILIILTLLYYITLLK